VWSVKVALNASSINFFLMSEAKFVLNQEDAYNKFLQLQAL